MSQPEYDQSHNKTGNCSKSHVTESTKQERDPDGHLHATVKLTCHASRDDWANSRTDAARSKENTNSSRSAMPDRKDSFAKHRQQGQYSATETPGGLDQ